MGNIIVYGTYHNRIIDGRVYSALNGTFEAGFIELPLDEFLISNGVTFHDELFNANYHAISTYVEQAVNGGLNSIIVSMRWELSADRTEVISVSTLNIQYGAATDLNSNEVAKSLDGVVELAAGVYADSAANDLTLNYIDIASYMVGYLQGKRVPGENLAPYSMWILNEARKIAGNAYNGEESEREALAKLHKQINAIA